MDLSIIVPIYNEEENIVALGEALVQEQPALPHPFSVPQNDDGSWRNPAGEYREDDPLVATSMAVLAMTR